MANLKDIAAELGVSISTVSRALNGSSEISSSVTEEVRACAERLGYNMRARRGVGTVGGAIIGALIMGVLNNGMSILGINVDWQQAIKGVVLLIAVLFDISSKNKQK